MNVQRSPTGCGPSERSRADSQPNLSDLKTRDDADYYFVSQRNKRKQPDEDYQIKSELTEIRKQMQEMMSFLTDFSKTQKDNIEKLSQDISSIKDQVCSIKTTSENVILEQNKMKIKLENVVKSTNATEKKIESLESDVQLLKNATSVVSPASPSQIVAAPQRYEDIVSEIQERYIRDKNIILTGLPEPQTSDLDERRDFDKNRVSKVLKAIYKDCPDPIKISRIGKYNSEKSRPLKVCFGSHETAKVILRNKNQENCGSVKIYSDQTKHQQAYMKDLKKQLQQRTDNGESNLTIKYIKGTPQIVMQQSKKSIQ